MADYLRKQLDIDGHAIFPYTHADSVVYTPKVNFGNSVPANTQTNVMAVLDALDNTYRRQDSNITSLYRAGGKSGFLYQNGISTTAFMNLPTQGANYYIPTLNYASNGNISTNWLSYTSTVTNGSAALVTSGAVYTAITSGIKANDAMLFKKVINSNSELPANHTLGWTYKVGTAGTYAGQVCEVGDIIICVTSRTTANNADWQVIQVNIDGAVITSNNTTSKHLAIFDGTRTIKPLTDTFPAVSSSGLLKLAVGGTDTAPTYTYSWDTTKYLSAVPEATTGVYGGFKLSAAKQTTHQTMNASTTGAGKYAVLMNDDGTLYVAITQANTNTWRSIVCDSNTATGTSTSSGVLKFVSGTNISLGWTNSSNAPTITVNHGSVTCTTTAAAAANSGTALSHSGEFVVPTAVTVSNQGHVTALTWTRYKLPASGNTDYTGIALKTNTTYGTKKTDTTLLKAASSTGLWIKGGTNKFLIGDGTNYIEVGVTPSITNNITGTGATNKLAVYTGTNALGAIDLPAKNTTSHLKCVASNTDTVTYTYSWDTTSYMPTRGGTFTGAVTFANSVWNPVGDDVKIGDFDCGGTLGIKSSNRDAAAIALVNRNNNYYTKIQSQVVTSNVVLTLPNKTGTIALTSDVSDGYLAKAITAVQTVTGPVTMNNLTTNNVLNAESIQTGSLVVTGESTFSNVATFSEVINGTAAAANKVTSALTIKYNTTKDSTLSTAFTYDGSATKTLSVKAGTGITLAGDTSGNITITNSSTNTDTMVTTALTTTKMYIIGKSDANKAKASTALYDANLYVTNGALSASSLATSGNITATGKVTGSNLWDIDTLANAISMKVSQSSWTEVGSLTGKESGTYVLSISNGNTVASGIISIVKTTTANVPDETALHVYSADATTGRRFYARTDAGKLYIASSDSAETTLNITVKIRRII